MTAYKATHSKFGENFSLFSSFYEGGRDIPKFERAIDAPQMPYRKPPLVW